MRTDEPYDMAIMDREVMQQDEVNWVKALGKDGWCRDLPLLLLTPLGSEEEKETAAIGFRKELTKPFKPKQLFDTLTELVSPQAKRERVTRTPKKKEIKAEPSSSRILLLRTRSARESLRF